MKHKLLSKLKIGSAIVLVVVALVLAYLVTPWFGNKVLIVRSGSMSPTLPVGSLVAIRPKELISSPLPVFPLYSPGDIISFKDAHNPSLITTHRVVSSKIENNQILYQTKGDANQTLDQSLVAEKNILGTTFLSLPYLGILFSFTKTKIGFLLLVLIPSLMVILIESWSIFKELRKKRSLRYSYLKHFRIHQGSTLTNFLPILAVGLVFTQTFAYFSDTASSTNNIFATAQSFCESPGPVFASGFSNQVVGTLKNGSPITDPSRINQLNGTGPDNWSPGTGTNFFSLGKNGSIVYEFTNPIDNGSGSDITLFEATNGRLTYPSETISVQGGMTNAGPWTLIGTATNNTGTADANSTTNLSFPPSLSSVKYLLLTETTDFGPHTPDSDGFDLDAIRGNFGCLDQPRG